MDPGREDGETAEQEQRGTKETLPAGGPRGVLRNCRTDFVDILDAVAVPFEKNLALIRAGRQFAPHQVLPATGAAADANLARLAEVWTQIFRLHQRLPLSANATGAALVARRSAGLCSEWACEIANKSLDRGAY